MIKESIAKDRENLEKARSINNVSSENAVYYAMRIASMEQYRKEGSIDNIKKSLEIDSAKFKTEADKIKRMYSGMLNFCEKIYGEDSVEIGALVTELAVNPFTSTFIADYGCNEYHKYDKKDIFKEKRDALLKEIEEIHIPDEYYYN